MLIGRAVSDLEELLVNLRSDADHSNLPQQDRHESLFTIEEATHLLGELQASSTDEPQCSHAGVVEEAADNEARQLRALCTVLGGVTVLLKGQWDTVCWGTEQVLRIKGDDCGGSPRRCGGQVRVGVIAGGYS